MHTDRALLAVLEKECASLGSSFEFSGSSRVIAQPSGHKLFAKLTTPADQVIGEGESLKAMRAAFPSNTLKNESLVPQVYACGKSSDGGKAYLITDWLDMSPRVGKKAQVLLGERLAHMHKNGTSKNGRFGFSVPTHCGVTEQDNSWTESWTDFWAEKRIGDLVRRISAKRADSELQALETEMKKRVYPILLSPLEGKISPAILHGDLWSGNAGEDSTTGNPVIFESSYYGHNEAELGMMHMFGGFTSDFFEAYHKVIPRCEPHYEQRIKLYELYHHLNHAIMFGGSYRGGAISIMRDLIQFAEKKGSDKAGL